MEVECERDTTKSLLHTSEKKASDLINALTDAERRACSAEAQVLALKARLYDYITAEA